MKRFLSLSLAICVGLAVFSPPADAGVPSTISYRGRLVDASGAPVIDGAQFVTFSIYTAPTGGTALWTSGIHPVTTVGGLFSYELGSNVGLPTSLFSDNPALYLGIQVGIDPEIAPRTQFGSSAFALQAEHADVSTNADNAQNLGNQAPSYYLDWNNLSGLPPGFADGVDNEGAGDISGVSAIGGLTGGGTTGDVTVKVAEGGITSSHIATGAISTDKVAERSLLGFDLQKNTITGSELAPDAVGSAELAAGAVRSTHVLDNSLTADDLAANSVGNSEIGVGAVASGEIFDGSISNVDIGNSAGIATSKISGTAVNQVSTQSISGQKTFSNLQIAPTTRKISLSAASFVSRISRSTITRGIHGGLIVNEFGAVEFYADISLPHGAILDQIEGTFVDRATNTDNFIYLRRVVRADPSISTVLASASTTGSGVHYQNVGDNSIVNPTVDNGTYMYFLVANWISFSDPAFQSLFYGATVTYTITRPLP